MTLTPFLKWAGGKRWLVDSYGVVFDIPFRRYIEPFAGSAAVFFHLLPEAAILSDKNKNLMNVYRAIKSDWRKVSDKLYEHSSNHTKDYYYHVRSIIYDDKFSQASQFIYLNRTCWNGIYRVNQNGMFNVPKGTKEKVILDTDDFETVSEYLTNASLLDGDFEEVVNMADQDDLLVIDPPYTANHNTNGFLRYNEKIFSWDDQIRLSRCVKDAKQRGVRLILTNADHESVRELYEDHFDVLPITRWSVLSGKSKFRRKVTELLVTG